MKSQESNLDDIVMGYTPQENGHICKELNQRPGKLEVSQDMKPKNTYIRRQFCRAIKVENVYKARFHDD